MTALTESQREALSSIAFHAAMGKHIRVSNVTACSPRCAKCTIHTATVDALLAAGLVTVQSRPYTLGLTDLLYITQAGSMALHPSRSGI